MGKKHLIGDKPSCLVPAEDAVDTLTPAQRRKSGRHGANRFATKHTGAKGQPGLGGERPQGNGNGKSTGNKKPAGANRKPAGQNKPNQGKNTGFKGKPKGKPAGSRAR